MRPLLGSFMRRCFDQLLLACFVGHIVFGCCSHHAHAAASNAVATVETSCPCGSHSDTPKHPAGQQPCERQGCDHGRCVFVRAESVDDQRVSADFGMVALAAEWPRAVELAPTDSIDAGRIHVAPFIRLHLLNQTLLI